MKKDTNVNKAAMCRRQKALIACLVVSTSIFAKSTYDLNVERHALNAEVNHLRDSVDQVALRNQDLSAALLDADEALRNANRRLYILLDDTDVCAASPAIYNIPLDADLQEYTYNRCVEYGIADYYELMLAMMWQESNFTADVISSSNDYGLMQINKCNHLWLRDLLGTTDFLDAKQNIDAGTYIMSKLLRKYRDEHKALMSYNMGERGARRNWEAGNYNSRYSRSIVAKRKAIQQITTEPK